MPCLQHPAVVDNLNACSGCGKLHCPDCLVEIKGHRFCAACKVEAVKDLQSGLSGTDLNLATIGQRVGAALIDWLIHGMLAAVLIAPVIIMVILSAKSSGKGQPPGLFLPLLQMGVQLVAIAGNFAYEGLFLQFKGATPGKMAIGLKVVNTAGQPLTASEAWVRTLVKAFANICGLTYFFAFFRPDRCALHDLAARTRVIKVN